MSKLGVRTVDELVGRSDLLMSSDRADERNVILDKIINNPYIDMPQNKVKYHEKNVYDFQLEKTVDMRILMKKLGPALEKGQKKSVELDGQHSQICWNDIRFRDHKEVRRVT